MLSIAIQCTLGVTHYKGAVKAWRMRSFNMDSLIVISTSASIMFGIALAIVGYSVEVGTEMH